jgi:porphobilinogen synthase
LEGPVKAGVGSILLFGLPEYKDQWGSSAWAEDGPVQQAVREAKRAFPELIVITDVCLCEYTSHGHCGPVKDGVVQNDEALPLLAKTALSHVRAGADMAAPSDMMDGRVAAIRWALDAEGYHHTPIMSYAVKYASAFYGPFREAAGSAPAFGDRRSYQMDPRNGKEALREARLDAGEGADILMVKPALPYLDVLYRVASESLIPVAAYSVSGEYAMMKAAARAGLLDESRIVCESALGVFRAGARILISYYAPELARWIAEGRI